MLKIRISSPPLKSTDGSSGSRVVVVGGGYTGAMVAKLLAERGFRQIEEITVFEPREHLGTGLAYDTTDLDVRLNVAAHRMRAVPGSPSAFLDWLQASGTLSVDPGAITSEGVFARRRDFGRFMQTQISPLVEDGVIRHVREAAQSVSRIKEQWRVTGAEGTVVSADVLILATGHPAASRPPALANLDVRTARQIRDALAPDAFGDIDPASDVLVVGSGLTALDALARLSARAHRGRVSLLSRSGLLPRPHTGGGFGPYGEFQDETLTSARRILARVRATIAEAEAQGIPWQSVFDALRQQSQFLWRHLPPGERGKLLRRLRRWYEVHRYRMPPQVSTVLEEGLATGRVDILVGTLASVQRDGQDLVARINTRNGTAERHYAHILLATGPDFRDYCSHQRLLLALQRDGFLQSEPLGLGLACDPAGRAIAVDGTPAIGLFVAGPPARPALGELTGVPEIATQAANLANLVVGSLARSSRTIVIGQRE